MDAVLRTLLLERLASSELDAEARRVIEVACAAGEAPSAASAPPVWLRSVTVEGFRGIGAPADADAGAGARADGRRRAQRERQVLVRRGARAADDRPAEALGEAPEGVDGDLAVPASRRRRRGSPPSWCWRARASAWRSRRSGRTARRTTTRAAAREPAAVLASHGWDRDLPSFRPFLSYAELATMFDTLSSLYEALTPVLGLGDVDELAGLARRRPPGLRQPAQGRRAAAATRWSRGWTPTTSTPRWSPPRWAPASRTSTRSPSCWRTPRTTAATPRSCGGWPGLHVPADEEIRDAFTAVRVAERAHKDAAATDAKRATGHRRAAAPRAGGPRPGAPDRRLPGLRHPGRARRGVGDPRGRDGDGARRAGARR